MKSLHPALPALYCCLRSTGGFLPAAYNQIHILSILFFIFRPFVIQRILASSGKFFYGCKRKNRQGIPLFSEVSGEKTSQPQWEKVIFYLKVIIVFLVFL
jgi:hypothetical protein